jgi:Ca2+-binding RTX toxin-like protein
MRGGAGDDIYQVDNAADVATEVLGEGSDTVFASVDYALFSNTNIEFLRGDAGATGLALTGNSIANTIVGLDGDDTLNGGGGADTLIGGLGSDFFVFDHPLVAGTVTTIVDFAPGTDQISLSLAVFAAAGAAGALTGAAFHVGAAAHDASDRIIYDAVSGALMYDVDGIGGAAAKTFANLAPGLAPIASDFVLV